MTGAIPNNQPIGQKLNPRANSIPKVLHVSGTRIERITPEARQAWRDLQCCALPSTAAASPPSSTVCHARGLWCASCTPRQGEIGFAIQLKIPSRVQLPPAAALRRSHTRAEGHRHFRAIHAFSWHTVNLRSAHLAPIIRTPEHFHVFLPPPHLSVRMFGSGGMKRAIGSSNCAAL
jgi:hypothetical protein